MRTSSSLVMFNSIPRHDGNRSFVVSILDVLWLHMYYALICLRTRRCVNSDSHLVD